MVLTLRTALRGSASLFALLCTLFFAGVLVGGSSTSDSINVGKWITFVLNVMVAGTLGGMLLFEAGLDPLVLWCTGGAAGAADVARFLLSGNGRRHRSMSNGSNSSISDTSSDDEVGVDR